MKTERFSFWPFLGLALLLVAQAPIAADNEIHLTEKVIASAEAKYSHDARRRIAAWTNLVANNKKKSEAEKLKLVNNFFNHVPFMSTMENWGRS